MTFASSSPLSPATESGGGLSGHSAIRIRFRCVLVIVSFLYALGRTLLFCINRAPFGVAKRAGQYVAELAANLAFHFVSLATIAGTMFFDAEISEMVRKAVAEG